MSRARTYIARAGDTWDLVALLALGSERFMGELIRVNEEHGYTVRFVGGEVLTIPPQPDSATAAPAPPWARRT